MLRKLRRVILWPLLLVVAWASFDALIWPRLRPIASPELLDHNDLIGQGEYIFNAAGCLGCHTDDDNNGLPLAGGRRIETDLGVFYSPNITADTETGIGNWELRDFIRALRYGIDPKGRYYYPVFPYTSYHQMQTQDMAVIFTYLQGLPSVNQANKAHVLPWYLRLRLVNWAWQKLYFKPGEFQAAPDQNEIWNRGAYLANAIAHCGECHTPRNARGALNAKMFYAGTRNGPDGETIPNITPHKKTGIGNWSADDLHSFLKQGMTPDGDFTGSLMAEVVDNSLQHLTDDDIDALVEYLRYIPAIENQVKKLKKQQDTFEY